MTSKTFAMLRWTPGSHDTRRFGFLVVLSLVVLTGCSRDDESLPEIRLERDTVDIGTVYGGDIRSFSIVVSNAGTGTLHISDINTSCGCTVARLDNSVLDPGRSGRLEMTFDSRGFSGRTTKRVVIMSDDPLRSAAEVVMTAEVRYELQMISHPLTVNLGKIPPGGVKDIALSFVNVSGKRVRALGVESRNDAFVVRIQPRSLQPGDTLSMALNVNPTLKGIIHDEVVLLLDSERQPKIPIRIVYSF